MKSKVTGGVLKPEFPRIMKGNNTGVIVLFTAQCSGMVIGNATIPYPLWTTYTYSSADFKEFSGEVVLSN